MKSKNVEYTEDLNSSIAIMQACLCLKSGLYLLYPSAYLQVQTQFSYYLRPEHHPDYCVQALILLLIEMLES
jgi:hypothetical protein